MKYVTDLLTRWGLATGRITGTELRGGSELNLAPALAPVMFPRFPQRITDPGVAVGTFYSESFSTANIFTQGASTAGLLMLLASVGRGMWEITLAASLITDFTMPAQNVAGGGLTMTLTDPANQKQITFLMLAPIAAVLQQSPLVTFTFTADRDAWNIRLNTPATGVGQNLSLSAFVIANRLS